MNTKLNPGDIVKLKYDHGNNTFGIIISIYMFLSERNLKVFWFNGNPFGILHYNSCTLTKVE